MDILEEEVKKEICDKIDKVKELLDTEKTKNIYDEIDKLVDLDNKDFAFKSIELFKPYIDNEVINVLTTKDICKEKTKHLRSILIDVTEEVIHGEKIDTLDERGKSRYYSETIEINENFYIISNDWYYKTHRGYDNVTPYLEYIKEVISKKETRVKGRV